MLSHRSCCWALHILRRNASLTLTRTNRMQVLTYDKAHTSTTQLFPSVARTAELVASQPGIWQYNCDVQDHLVAGVSQPVHPVNLQRVCMLHVVKGCGSSDLSSAFLAHRYASPTYSDMMTQHQHRSAAWLALATDHDHDSLSRWLGDITARYCLHSFC